MADPAEQIAVALADFSGSVALAVAELTKAVKAVQDDHAKGREDLYALTQRVEDLERRARK